MCTGHVRELQIINKEKKLSRLGVDLLFQCHVCCTRFYPFVAEFCLVSLDELIPAFLKHDLIYLDEPNWFVSGTG